MTTLAVVRNIGSAAALRSDDDIAAFAQEIIDQYPLAMAAAGLTDGYVSATRTGDLRVRRVVVGTVVVGVV